jgi:branched-chain amino acid transport system ATP-binding protein
VTTAADANGDAPVTALLEIEGLSAGYGDFQALFEIDLSVDRDETVAVIGANGAGKTTLLRAIAGLVPATSGTLRFDGRDMAPVPSHRRVGMGIAMVPEGRMLFPSLSVRENLLVGGHSRRDGGWTLTDVIDVFPLIGPLLERNADVLSGGERQAVAIARGLMANPRLLLLDEVSIGLAPVVVKDLYAVLPTIIERGTTALIVEQDISQAMAVADRAVCLLEGRISLVGKPADLDRGDVTAAYFGER